MKIIKPGTPPPLKNFSGDCAKCGCQFECTDAEAECVLRSTLDGPMLWTIICPTCSACVIVTPMPEAKETRMPAWDGNAYRQILEGGS